uniref:SURP and G-patch domain-containing protein 1-like n=1 Tax=Phallusia mammillata TaxID=59560 RepID=A0A6F9DTD1_9ASCI|nr:SURP and G-patch domain-containing protein 1-like [Phallusia mammillata]
MASNTKLEKLNQQSDLLAKKLKEIEEKKAKSEANGQLPNDGNFMKNFLNQKGSANAASQSPIQPKQRLSKPPAMKSRFSSMFQQMKHNKMQASPAPVPTATSVTAKCFHNDDSSSSDEDTQPTPVKKLKTINRGVVKNAQIKKAVEPAIGKTPSALITSSLPKNAQNMSFGNDVTKQTSTPPKAETEMKQRKKKNRWGEKVDLTDIAPPGLAEIPGMTNPVQPVIQATPASLGLPATYRPVGLVGVQQLSTAQKKQLEEQREMQAMYSLVMANRNASQQAAAATAAAAAQADAAQANAKKKKFKHEYDSDEDIDDVTGTWEHKQRYMEMEKTKALAEKLTEEGQGKHFLGDFLPPAELEKFMETFKALKEGRTPDYSDYKEFKIQCDNVGFKMLAKMGWEEGKGLGSEGQGITAPVNQGQKSIDGRGLGIEKPDNLSKDDDDFSAYRKRMMLAYKFRPNPLNNPRRPYY